MKPTPPTIVILLAALVPAVGACEPGGTETYAQPPQQRSGDGIPLAPPAPPASEPEDENDTRSTCADLEPLPVGSIPYNAQGEQPAPWNDAPVLSAEQARDPAALSRVAGFAIVRNADLRGVSFAGARLRGICFENANLAGSDWTGATLDRVAFVRSNLTGAKLRARFPGSAFVSSTLDKADAAGADLSGAAIVGGTFSGLSLRDANLRNFKLECGANHLVFGDHCTDNPYPSFGEQRETEPVDARGADLTGAAFSYWDGHWRVEGATVDRTRVELENAPHLKGAVLKGPVLVEASGYTPDGVLSLTPAEWQSLEAAWRPELETRSNQPSFDCRAAKSRAERRICAPDNYGQLAELDRELAGLHGQALAGRVTTPAEQRRWLAARDACTDDECLSARYEERVGALRGRLARFALPKPGAEAVYVGAHAPVTPEFRRTALYARLAPAIMTGMGNTLYVRGLDGGRVEAMGTGLFFNGHTCSLWGGPFRFDPQSGWFMGRRDPANLEPGEPAQQRVLRLWGDHAEVNTEANDFTGCGARGSWGGVMVRLPAPPDVLARARETLNEEP